MKSTAGLDLENETKPELTKQIEGADDPQTPEVCATKLLRGSSSLTNMDALRVSYGMAEQTGIERGNYFITSDIIGDLFRNNMRGTAPTNTFFTDTFWGCVGPVRVLCISCAGRSTHMGAETDRATHLASHSGSAR